MVKKLLVATACLCTMNVLSGMNDQTKYFLEFGKDKIKITRAGLELSEVFKEMLEQDEPEEFNEKDNTFIVPLQNLSVSIDDITRFAQLCDGMVNITTIKTEQLIPLIVLADFYKATRIEKQEYKPTLVARQRLGVRGHNPTHDLLDELLSELAGRIKEEDYPQFLQHKGLLWQLCHDLPEGVLERLKGKLFVGAMMKKPQLLKVFNEEKTEYFVLSNGMIACVPAVSLESITSITIINPRTGLVDRTLQGDFGIMPFFYRYDKYFEMPRYYLCMLLLARDRIALIERFAIRVYDFKTGTLVHEIKLSKTPLNAFRGPAVELDNGTLVCCCYPDNQREALYAVDQDGKNGRILTLSEGQFHDPRVAWSIMGRHRGQGRRSLKSRDVVSLVPLAGGHCAVMLSDFTVQIWNLSKGKPVKVKEQRTEQPTDRSRISFSDLFVLPGNIIAWAQSTTDRRTNTSKSDIMHWNWLTEDRPVAWKTIDNMSALYCVALSDDVLALARPSTTIVDLSAKNVRLSLPTEEKKANQLFGFSDGMLIEKWTAISSRDDNSENEIKVWQVLEQNNHRLSFEQAVFVKALRGLQQKFQELQKKEPQKKEVVPEEKVSMFGKLKKSLWKSKQAEPQEIEKEVLLPEVDKILNDVEFKNLFISLPETEDVADLFKNLHIQKRHLVLKITSMLDEIEQGLEDAQTFAATAKTMDADVQEVKDLVGKLKATGASEKELKKLESRVTDLRELMPRMEMLHKETQWQQEQKKKQEEEEEENLEGLLGKKPESNGPTGMDELD